MDLSKMNSFKIGSMCIGEQDKCIISFEPGGTFQNIQEAKEMIKFSANAGADAIKFQTFFPGDADRIMGRKDITVDYTTPEGEKQELIYISRALVPGTKNKHRKVPYNKQVCIYAFNKDQLKKFHSCKKKSVVEKIEDIEILRFFELNIKIKMIKLNSNSVAVDEVKDVKKAEKLILKRQGN